ncbi:MAG TPA: hypothetical protein VM619_16390 [Luteimonas sp.]|nr:hypothetical protein [Luteimonas sp.]
MAEHPHIAATREAGAREATAPRGDFARLSVAPMMERAESP